MSYSDDDFGLDDDDDTVFLAAATQLEAPSANDVFSQSPRPNKRRRIEIGDSASDREDNPEYDSDVLFEDYESQHADPVSEAEQTTKPSKYKIHIPKNPNRFEAVFLTQTQTGLDADPGAFRGAIWKKPAVPAFNAAVSQTGHTASNANQTGQTLISNMFSRTHSVEDDARLARQLQAEENALTSQQRDTTSFKAPQRPNPILRELQDLPSDAFSSSPAQVIDVSSQDLTSPVSVRPTFVRAPQTGLKQMTIHGQTATQELTSSQAASKKCAWPLKSRDEKETHHKLNDEAMRTWIYPTNLGTIRDYQFNIVKRSLFYNTLVALPTGLGKTFIAATVMLNYYRWTTDAQIVFMAPTKPLIAQQMEACYHIVGIPRHDTVLMTGESAPAIRGEEWREKRVFFMTPQTVINDLKTGICDPKRLVLIVVDEAHKATGGYAYTEVIQFTRRFNESFRVLALTATPGSKIESVQAVIENLDIARVELRTEESIDIQKYTHEKHTETELFDPSDGQALIMECATKALKPTLDKLNGQNAYWSRDPMSLTAFGLNQSRQKWNMSEAGRKAPVALKGMVNSAFTVLSQIAHGVSLLKFHGIGPFLTSASGFQRSVDTGETKGKIAKAITESADWTKMMNTMRTWVSNPDFIGHPKLEYLREVVLNHFLDAGEGRHGSDVSPSATRVMIFASYRDSTEEIVRVLKRNEPMIRPHHFVGQTGKVGSEGMNQKKQNQVVQDFKSGKYNTLVATSIGEEGLDIGDVDLIICYDSSASPIRMLQRIGRTGRKRVGRVVLLLMKGKEENDYSKAQDNYRHIQKTIANVDSYKYCEDRNRRILPRTAEPIVDKRIIEIPVENTQPLDLNEKARKGRGKAKTKRAPKKFHMPDGVRTGFVKASRLGSDVDVDEGDDPDTPAKKKPKTNGARPAVKARAASPEPPVAQLPFLQDVILSSYEQDELERKYARVADGEADLLVAAPDISQLERPLRDVGQTKYVPHGRFCRTVCQAVQAMSRINEARIKTVDEMVTEPNFTQFSKSPGLAASRIAVIRETLPDNRASLVEEAREGLQVPAPRQKKSQAKKRAPSKTQARAQVRAKIKPADVATPTTKRTKGRQKKPTSPSRGSYGYEAGEGAESSPEPTPAEMRLATQGIDLGSRDTSGEDEAEEEELDSELEDFVARSDEIIETFSSSLPHIPGDSSSAPKAPARRVLQRKKALSVIVSDREEKSVDDDAENEDDLDPLSQQSLVDEQIESEVNHARTKKRRIIDESDESE